MSEETIKNLLKDLGLTETESDIYLFLSKRGLSKVTEIAKQVGKDKAQIYHILKSLQTKGLVESTLESPVRFNPISFEQVLERAVKTKQDEANRIQSAKHELLTYWKKINREKIEIPIEKFVVIEGRQKIYNKISQMLSQTNEQMSIISSLSGLLREEQFGVYDNVLKNKLYKGQFRFITEITKESIIQTKTLLKKFSKKKFTLRARNKYFNINLFHKIIIRDDEETLFFITSQNKILSPECDDLCLWTNCKDIVKILLGIFDETWQNSIDIETKIEEIETGKTAPKTIVINNSETANKMYRDTLDSAKNEIKAILSPIGLNLFCTNQAILKKEVKEIKIKIMAPITIESQKCIQKLPAHFEVRHIPIGYMETVLIDGTSLFEFKSVKEQNTNLSISDTLFSDDKEHIQQIENLFEYLWSTAQVPSKITLETISEMSMAASNEFLKGALSRAMQKMDRVQLKINQSEKISENELIKKMISSENNTELSSESIKTFGTLAQAIVHPPREFNLPDLLFHIYHFGKQSTYGTEDVLLIHPWLKTPLGYAYVVSAVLTDNPKAVSSWKKICANSPAENNVTIANPDELEVRVHGDTFFVGWTKTIVVNPKIIIPPSCLLIERYGKLDVDSYSVNLPSGYTLKTEGTHSEAFVTYLHPISKYQGPGSDGAIGKDVIMQFMLQK